MPESMFTNEPPPRRRWRRQFRLETLLFVVTLAAALFAWARTWTAGTLRDIVFLGSVMAFCLAPPLIARRLIQTEFVRRRSYLLTLMISQTWFPLAIVAVIGFFDYRGITRSASLSTLGSYAALSFMASGAFGVVLNVLLPRRDETFRAVVAASLNSLVVFLFILFTTEKDLAKTIDLGITATIVGLWFFTVFPINAFFTFRAMDLREQRNSLRLRSRTPPDNVDFSKLEEPFDVKSVSVHERPPANDC
ncbi:MAG: hypothetical protein JNK76_07680 [Planctomycetales bacterium]|nr:hypothetical protein [Planctomycetales bacterium]MBN8626095.1 hypothetical protein [Planctomycetota bacterium]